MFDVQLTRQRLMRQLHDPADLSFVTDFCPQCQDMMPLFVSDELADKTVDSLYPDIAYHLDLCLNCQIEYGALSVMTSNALYSI